MAMLRSARLCAGYVSILRDWESSVWTVPFGYRAIVRNITVANPSTSVDTLVIVHVHRSGESLNLWLGSDSLRPQTTRTWVLDQVLEAGDNLNLYIAQAPVSYYVSGALLPLPV